MIRRLHDTDLVVLALHHQAFECDRNLRIGHDIFPVASRVLNGAGEVFVTLLGGVVRGRVEAIGASVLVHCWGGHWPGMGCEISKTGRLEKESLLIAVSVENADVVLEASTNW